MKGGMTSMEEQNQIFGNLTSFAEALLCSPSVYLWQYAPDGALTAANCEEHVFHRIFEHTGCLAYMIQDGTAERTPLILGAELGILWAVVYDWNEGRAAPVLCDRSGISQ